MRADATWTAMGSKVHVAVVDGMPGLLDAARNRIAQLERRWSRFIPTSEVSRLAAARGTAVAVSPDTVLLVQRAVLGWRLTDGAFDPTVLGALLREGYTRTFELIDGSASEPVTACDLDAAGIEVDAVAGAVRIPAGVGFDPGGVGKGLAADIVSAELVRAGAAGVCVNVGGDVRVRGRAPDGRSWRVDVEDPHGDGDAMARLRVVDGAVATSSPRRRRWLDADGVEHHHLIDPATGASARTAVAAATVVASDGWRAEVLTKAVVLDPVQGLALVERLGAAALVVADDGSITTSARWPGFAVPREEATT